MSDVIPTRDGSDRFPLAASLACFAVAGIATVVVDGVGFTLGATGLAVGGVYCLARDAESVTRQTLAHTALGLWIAFLGIAAIHAIGLEAIGATVPGPTLVTVVAVSGATWATLLGAAGATIFLGFREYGSSVPVDDPDDAVFDGETSDYSTR
ncbi:hypothetical protein [Natrinema salsiterrestre]|uniref:Uncharacterized protein n=1 Tax=Natrinema salsiterrestre TaxID=2950540 RepID=A0A9Q4Q0D9_9EURY|nr:hypothetical protein [Natrinema salsiterrestre]MDF9746415.1 hypothetical protein [Natrinema salsiterrestre]